RGRLEEQDRLGGQFGTAHFLDVLGVVLADRHHLGRQHRGKQPHLGEWIAVPGEPHARRVDPEWVAVQFRHRLRLPGLALYHALPPPIGPPPPLGTPRDTPDAPLLASRMRAYLRKSERRNPPALSRGNRQRVSPGAYCWYPSTSDTGRAAVASVLSPNSRFAR